MRTLAIRTLLGAGLTLGICNSNAKAEAAAAMTLEEAKKAESHVLATKEFKPSPKGETTTTEEVSEMKDGKMTIEVGGNKLEGTMTRNDVSVTSIVALGDTKARRTLESKTSNSKMILNGQERPMPDKKDGLLGVSVLLEYKDGKRSATLESGATPKGEQVKALETLNKNLSSNGDVSMYGDTPRKVGDKWNVDPKTLTAFGEARKMTGTYTVEFAEIKEFQGTPCAVLKAQFDIAMEGNADDEEEEENEAAPMKMSFKGSALIHRSLAGQEDLDAKITADMTLDASPQPGMKMHVEGPFRMS